MKNKIFSLILMFCLILPCMVMLSACKEEGDKTVYINVNSVEELKSALTNNIKNDIIKLNKHLDLERDNENKALVIDSGKNVLDLNGFTLIGVDNSVDSWHVIDLRGEGTELTIKDSSEDMSGGILGRCYGIQVSRGAKLTIESGNFLCVENEFFNQSVVVYGGTLVVNGGVFITKSYETIHGKSYTWDEVLYKNHIEINGGNFNYIGEEENEFGLFLFEGTDQTVVVNGGTFNNNYIKYIVACDSTVNLVNNAQIPEEQIVVWDVE